MRPVWLDRLPSLPDARRKIYVLEFHVALFATLEPIKDQKDRRGQSPRRSMLQSNITALTDNITTGMIMHGK